MVLPQILELPIKLMTNFPSRVLIHSHLLISERTRELIDHQVRINYTIH